MTPRVLIVDDHALFRAGVKAELADRAEVVGEAGSVEEAVTQIASKKPDVVLLDVHMPAGGGVEVIRRAQADPAPRYLALSVSDDPEAVPPERHGLRESIRGRMRRAGGSAVVRAQHGRGTEVELSIAREPSR